MLFGNYNEKHKNCVFKCQKGKHFFRFPSSPKARQVWLDNLGLKSVSTNSRICDNHFSDRMFAKSAKRLTRTAIPDKNLAPVNGDLKLDEDASNQLESVLDRLLGKDDAKQTPPEDLPLNNKLSKSLPPVVNAGIGTPKFLGDASKLLMNYQLRNQGRHICDVAELPEFILVFTAFRTKDTFIIPPSDLPDHIQTEKAEEPPKTMKNLKIAKTSKGKRNLKKVAPQKDETILPKQVSHEIKYVHYTPRKNVVQRERETQVNASCETKTAEIGVQCDEESPTSQDDSSELEWINHIIEAHVLNAEGDMYECHICGEIAASYTSKLQHSLVHKESSSLCFHCGRLFSTHLKLKNHERKAHLEKKFEIKKALRCPKFHCTKAFHSRRQLFDHIDQHTKKTEKRCEKCQREFSSSIQLHCHKSRRNCLK